jgi:transposase
MPRRNYALSPEEHSAVSQALIHHAKVEVRLACKALLILHDGHMPAEVAKECGVDRRTVYRWQERYGVRRQVDDLVHLARTGRPRKVTDAYIAALERTLETDPAACGYAFAVWTVERLRTHLAQRTGIVISTRSLELVLARQGYVYRRPKATVKHLQDPEAVAQAQANWERLKRGPKAQPTPTGLTSSSPWTKRR